MPVLMHWQFGMYNHGFDRFFRVLEKFPDVNFVGHAQTWWGNIDQNHMDQAVMYPKGPVTRGGLTDRYLSDYANMYGDLSAGSGLNALTRILAAELRSDGILVNAVCPGWTATDMGEHGGRPVEEGARGIVWAAELPDDGPTGGFFRDGRPIPW